MLCNWTSFRIALRRKKKLGMQEKHFSFPFIICSCDEISVSSRQHKSAHLHSPAAKTVCRIACILSIKDLYRFYTIRKKFGSKKSYNEPCLSKIKEGKGMLFPKAIQNNAKKRKILSVFQT